MRSLFNVLLLIVCLGVGLDAYGQKRVKATDQIEVSVPEGYVLVLKDTFYMPESDSVISIAKGSTYSVKKSPYFKSDKFYDSLQSKASRTKLTRSLYSLLFNSSTATISEKKSIVSAEEPFKPFVGKRYGHITIKQVPILEGSVRDTTKQASSWYAKTFNKIHISTKKMIIRQNVFIKEGDKVDPYELADNERILRQFRTIRDAKIYLSPSDHDPEVVDVIIVTQDVVSLGGALSYTNPSDFAIDIYQRNILGFARDFQVTYDFNEHSFPDKKHGYAFRYRVPNLWGTFIRGTLLYENYGFREQLAGFLSRDFFTPEIKYGGGASFAIRSSFYQPILQPDTLIPYQKNEASIWVGRSYQLAKRTNAIIQAAYAHNQFNERPSTSENRNRYFINNDQLLISAALYNRTYSKSKLVRGFGRTEDISKGYLLSFTYGFDALEFYNRSYWEVKSAYAEYFQKIGYLYFSSALGAFKPIESNSYEDGLFRTQLRYFSPLIKERRANYRQFVSIEYTKGINFRGENYLLVDNIYTGDNPVRPFGNERLTLDFETVFFTPWYFYGCKFAFYNRYKANWLTNDQLLSKESFFSAYSLGLRLLNESLVFPTIELSFTYFDGQPQYANDHQFRIFNNYSNTFQDLDISRPSVLEFEN